MRPLNKPYLMRIMSSSAKLFPSPGQRWMVTELTMLPPNLGSCTSGSGLLLARRDDPGSSPDGQGDDVLVGGSRSMGKVLSTSDGSDAGPSSSWTRTASSAIRTNAHSPLSEPPTTIHPYPAARHFGSKGMTATLSRLRDDIWITYITRSTTT